MQPILGKFEPQAYAILRIMAGLLFMQHGVQKLFGWLSTRPAVDLVSLRGLAGIIETFGGLMLVLGLWGSVAAFIASGTMAVAYFMAHAKDGFFPIVNRGELAVLYCFVFLYIAARGSGIWSVDRVMSRKNTG